MQDKSFDVTEQAEINAKARASAQAEVEGQTVKSTSLVEYHSEGKVAVIGGIEAHEFASRLTAPLRPQVILIDGAEEPGVPVIALGRRSMNITGHMGAFSITLGDEGKANYECITADLVLDLSPTPFLSMPIKPPGYLVADTDERDLSSAAAKLEELAGNFEKPRYFEYDASICAHGRSGQSGCNRCIESCPAEAIISLGESIEVNPYLCQGGGVCASVCPSGAIRYNYPDAADMVDRIRRLLKVYHENGGQQAIIGFIAEADVETLHDIPENLIIVVIEELASVGIDVWLSSLAYGAKSVLLIDGGSVPDMVLAALDEQLLTTGAILDGMGYMANAIHLISTQVLTNECEAIIPEIEIAKFAGLDEKRRATFMAIDHLYEQAAKMQSIIPLPYGALFGAIHVDSETCTLCMSCTSVCPAGAVQAGNEVPQLTFYEANCLQCGVCEAACPENAISLEPRLMMDSLLRRQSRILHEEPPFCCISCGKAFATNSVITNILAKLEGHAMFQDERARRRLMMCEDCRVVDIVQDQELCNKLNKFTFTNFIVFINAIFTLAEYDHLLGSKAVTLSLCILIGGVLYYIGGFLLHIGHYFHFDIGLMFANKQ